jgi:hypothetical protein
MPRRTFLAAVWLAVFLLPFAFPPAGAAGENSAGGQVAELHEQLESGLKARLPGEFSFIALVVQKVEQRQLTTGEVKAVFQWARRKNKNVPFPHFERAMRIIAGKKGVAL